MKKWAAVLAVFLALNLRWSIALVEGKMDNFPRLPGATLLMGYPPRTLVVTSGDATSKLQAGGGDWFVMPSMSADGHLIASARIPVDVPAGSRGRPELSVSVYSTMNQRWTDYKELGVFDGSISISPDGTKVACITRKVAGAPSHLSIFDLRSRTITMALKSPDNAGPGVSWSPDGLKIAFDRETPRSVEGNAISPLRTIYVLNIATGAVSKIADGIFPSWSPSGEWIAFYDYSPHRDDAKLGWYATNADRVSVVRPDGTGQQILLTLHPDDSLNVAPVWSPDSKTILLNKVHDQDKSTMDIYFLNTASDEITKKFRDVPPIYARVAAK